MQSPTREETGVELEKDKERQDGFRCCMWHGSG
jgi:hypothetical protein